MKLISCPSCGQLQTFEYSEESRLYFPIKPFCCIVMEHSDTAEWNAKLDKALKCAIDYVFHLQKGEIVV